MTARVLVTGASGIAGAHVATALEARGHAVVLVSREPRHGWAVADLASASEVRGLPPFDAVVHCAALTPRSGVRDPEAYRAANVTSTRLLAEEAVRRGARRFVYLSTMGRAEQQDERAGALYVESKREAERVLMTTIADRLPVWIVRAASLYGEHDRGSMARLIRAVASGRFVALGSLSHRKCLLYAGSLAALVAAEIEQRDTRNEAAHDTRTYRFAEVLAAVETAVRRRAPRLGLPDALAGRLIGSAHAVVERTGPVRLARLLAAASVAMRDVPCEDPNAIERVERAVELEEGVRREVAWLGANAHG